MNGGKPKLIEAVPLSVPRTLEGVFYWYEDFVKLKEKPRNVILGHEIQDPNLLVYKDYVQGYILKVGGYTAHLAIVGRELGIPVYRYSDLDKLVSGEYIIVVPIIERIEFPETYVWTIRQISEDRESTFKDLKKNFGNLIEIINTFNRYLRVDKFVIEYDSERNDRIIYAKIMTSRVKEFFDWVINNPREVMETLLQEDNIGASFLCRFIAEGLVPYLMQQVGIEKALKAIHRHTPYWLQVHEDYLKIRFGISDKSVRELLHRLREEAKRETVRLEEPYESLAELIARCIEKFEYKNIKTFRK